MGVKEGERRFCPEFLQWTHSVQGVNTHAICALQGFPQVRGLARHLQAVFADWQEVTIMRYELTAGIFLALAACTDRPLDSGTPLEARDGAGDLPPLECALGDPTFFSLNPLPELPSADAVRFDEPFTLVPPSVDQNLRLDFCLLPDGKLDFQRFAVMTRTRSGVRPFVHPIAPEFDESGLNAFLFGGDAAEFAVTLPTQGSYIAEYRLKGWKAGEVSFVTVAAFAGSGETLSMEDLVIAATLDYGDFATEGGCRSFEKFKTSTLQMNTATLTFGYCTFPSGGETVGFRISGLKVSDSNPGLTAEQRREFSFDEDALADVLKYRWNHHNSCDAFTVRLPHATYAATSGATFTMDPGHCAGFEEAPARDPNDHGNVKWVLRYTSGEEAAGFGEAAHFLSNFRGR